jgi:short-subunit dehydrogenase
LNLSNRRVEPGGRNIRALQAVYGASKAYVSTLMRALSVELAGTGVSVGSFAPGGIDTDTALSDLVGEVGFDGR